MKLKGITIDPAHALDLDDAIWVDALPIGGWRVQVSVANVAREVRLGSPEDIEARARVATRYHSIGNRPMLPRRISEGHASLLPHEPRRVVSVRFFVSTSGEVQNPVVGLGMLWSSAKLAYEDVPRLLEESGKFSPMLRAARDCALTLIERRRQSGALALYDLNNGWILTEEGWLRQIADKREVMGQIIVQEMMVATNRALADFAADAGLPVIFRNHRAQTGATPHAALLAFLEEALSRPVTEIDEVRQLLGGSLERARYSASPEGHFGLNVPRYLHGTSPIRRYADLVSQRQIVAYVLGETPPYTREELINMAEHINQAIEAEREERGEVEKDKANERAADRIEHGRFEGLDTKGVERAVKVLVRAGGDVPAQARRLFEQELSLVALAWVLVGSTKAAPGWLEVRGRIVERLDGPRALSVIACAAQAPELGFGGVAFEESAEGPSHAPLFRATAVATRWGQEHRASAEGASKQDARQQAAIGLLRSVAALPALARPKATPAMPPAAPKLPAPLPGEPIAAVHELARRGGLPAPTFAFEQGGAAHVPTFACVVDLGGQRHRGTGRTKQVAKRAACEAAIAVERARS